MLRKQGRVKAAEAAEETETTLTAKAPAFAEVARGD